MSSDKDVWEAQYAQKGDVWRGRSDFPFDLPKGRVLELGCGNGKTASALISKGVELVCLDISRNALLACERSLSSRADFIEGDILALPFKDKVFDSVVCFHVLEHLLENERISASKEIFRVLKNNGNLYVQSFSVNDMRFGKGSEVESYTFVRGDLVRYHYFREGEIERLFYELSVLDRRIKVIDKRFHGEPMKREVVQIKFEKA